jgi:hypothetical protein
MNRSSHSKKCSVPLALTWTAGDTPYRATAWPEVEFERRYGAEWIAVVPSEETLQAAAGNLNGVAWRSFLEFVPIEIREFLGLFRANRMVALLVVARCPALLSLLAELPTIVPFIAAHARLRGSANTSWTELNAVFERNGVYGVLEWLGLPASRQTLAILQNVVTPDLPGRLLEPLRTMLWKPQGILALAQLPEITERELSLASHALAA